VTEKGPIVNVVNSQIASEVLRALSRAQRLFGGDTAPVDPPAFPAPRDLEDRLGHGTFSADLG
jgi:hypothetical protein